MSLVPGIRLGNPYNVHTLRGKLTLAFGSLLFLFAAGQLAIYSLLWRSGSGELLELVHWGFAQEVALDLQPILSEKQGINIATLQSHAQRYERLNTSASVFILDDQGLVLADLSGWSTAGSTVPIAPVRDFISDTGKQRFPHKNIDPREASKTVPFVAAPVNVAGKNGFVYITLWHDRVRSFSTLFLIDSSYRSLILYTAATLLTTMFVASVLSKAITKRFQSIVKTLGKHRSGDLTARVPAGGDDELAVVSLAVNEMAEAVAGTVTALHDKDTLRRELILNMWHDLRGPVTGIKGNVELLEVKEPASTNADRSIHYSRIRKSADLLTQLLSALHELAQLEARENAPALAVTSVTALAEDIVLAFKMQAEERGVTLTLDVPQEELFVNCDSGMISRAVGNLLENGLRYTASGGSLSVQLTPSENTVLLSVRDTGIGIPAESLPHLFERSFQVSGRENGAAGLGLSIVRCIIEAHGSSIQVESRETEGTTFSFALNRHSDSVTPK